MRNLFDLFNRAAQDPRGSAVTVYGPDHVNGFTLTYQSLLTLAEHKSIQLQQKLGRIDTKVVLVYFTDHLDGIVWFWAVVLAGGIPCICPPLARDPEQRLQNVRHLQVRLQNPLVITTKSLASEFPSLERLRVVATSKNP